MLYENTHIYARSMELLRLSRQVLDDLPTGFGFLADQLRRASSSVHQNFAEGYGKGTAKDSRRFFHIARGSANEVAAIFDVAHEFGAMTSSRYAHGKDLCDQLARMLSKFPQGA